MRPGPVGCAAFAACFLLSLAQCDRAPPEPVATASAKSKARCVVATSDKPAAPVPPGPDPSCPADPDGSPEVPIGKVTFPATPRAPVLDVELMIAEAHRNRGLMYRREMAESHGMLFVFDDQQVRTFWMHNTCMPLDMLFVGADGFITGILENVPTMNDDPRTIGCKAKYVLEVNAGFTRRYGIRAGQSIKIEGAPLGRVAERRCAPLVRFSAAAGRRQRGLDPRARRDNTWPAGPDLSSTNPFKPHPAHHADAQAKPLFSVLRGLSLACARAAAGRPRGLQERLAP